MGGGGQNAGKWTSLPNPTSRETLYFLALLTDTNDWPPARRPVQLPCAAAAAED